MVPCSTSGGGKRRRLEPDGAESSSSSSWASLPQDLVQLIAWRVLAGDLLDYVRFRAVCAHWSSSTARPRFHPRRWMLLPEGHGLYPGHASLGGYVRFLNLSTAALVRSSCGTAAAARDTAVRLLHPFTGDVAELPPLSSVLPQLDPYARRRAAATKGKLREIGGFLGGTCAAVAVGATEAITVMLALDAIGMNQTRRVAYADAGDRRWTLSAWIPPRSLTQMVSFHGKLYATSLNSASDHDDTEEGYYPDYNKVYIYRTDPPQPDAEGLHSLSLSPPRLIAECPLLETIGSVHLVECGSELLFVGSTDTSDTHLVVYRLADLIIGRVVPIRNIGDHAIFMDERGLCLSPNKGIPSVLGNSYHLHKKEFCRSRGRTAWSAPMLQTC
ncbi:hypothetical protein ACP4OV_019734 [Aristida adscensionis]